jgi:hypothetical protein
MAYSGGVAIASGLYSCSECRGVARLDAGEIAPPCPSCHHPVTWLYLGRGPFLGTDPDPAVEAAHDEGGEDVPNGEEITQ